MKQGPSFIELLGRLNEGDEQAAAQLVKDFEPVIRRELRFRLRGNRARLELDSMDISQSVLGNFFLQVARRQYDLKEPGDLVRLVTMTRNKLAEKLRSQHRQRRDSRRTLRGVENVELASPDPPPLPSKAALSGRPRIPGAPRRGRRCPVTRSSANWDEVVWLLCTRPAK